MSRAHIAILESFCEQECRYIKFEKEQVIKFTSCHNSEIFIVNIFSGIEVEKGAEGYVKKLYT